MAPPNARRTGFSKRAQYTTFFGYLAAIAGGLVGAVLLVISLLNPSAFAALRGLAADAAAPAGEVAAARRSGTHTALSRLWGYLTWGPRVATMRSELEATRVKLAENRATADEN